MAGFGREKGNILKVINFCSPAKPSASSKKKKKEYSG
jgi:hypothetical protein